MKKIILLLSLMLTSTIFAQEATTETPKVSYYTSVGVSIPNLNSTSVENGNTVTTNSQFTDVAYPSLEFGVTKGNLSLGAIVGRGSLNFSEDAIRNYYYELKSAVSQPVGNANVYALFGVGNYVDQNHIFVEYGAGLAYSPSKLGYFVQASNWDGIWYVTPGLTYNF